MPSLVGSEMCIRDSPGRAQQEACLFLIIMPLFPWLLSVQVQTRRAFLKRPEVLECPEVRQYPSRYFAGIQQFAYYLLPPPRILITGMSQSQSLSDHQTR